jgi:hypothetical protein
MLNAQGEKPYEGAELFTLYGNTTDGDGNVRQVYLRGGLACLDGKVSIAAAGEYYARANLYSRDRVISATGDTSNDSTGLGLGGVNSNSPTFGGFNRLLSHPTRNGLTCSYRIHLHFARLSESLPQSTYFCAIGIRRPTPNARLVTLMPGAACSRLYSLMSTRRCTHRTVFSSKPWAIMSRALMFSST